MLMNRNRREAHPLKALALATSFFLGLPLLGQAQTNFQRLLSFGLPATPGSFPRSAPIEGGDGLLYGVTYSDGGNSLGKVYSLQKDGSDYTVLQGLTNGSFPVGGLVQDNDGTLYGTTSAGGSSNYGTVFKLSTNGTGFSIIHNFTADPTNGSGPTATLIKGGDGYLYGTTSQGGSNNLGTVFKLKPDGNDYLTLHHFAGVGVGDGASPNAGLVQGVDGALYGTTSLGGSNNLGTVFCLDTNGSDYQVLHHFASGDGNQPVARLLLGSDGMLYGTASVDGISNRGTIFKLGTNGTGFVVLHDFKGADGRLPSAGLVQASGGALYGTARLGGSNDMGVAFTVSTNGTGFSVLHHFKGVDGNQPYAELLLASNGALYGTTYFGGDTNTGVLFRLLAATPQVVIRHISLDGTGAKLSLTGGAADQNYNIEATTNLGVASGWQVIGSSPAGVDGTFQFLDPDATHYPERFYRSAIP
jgi:uncharacterized repeat protein (TIGR03803 family)